VQALLQGGADVDKARDDGTTPLFIASQQGHLPVVQALLQGGADTDKVADNGATPLCMSSHQGHVPVVHALLQGGADVDKARDDSITPLIIATQWGHLPIVQALLQAGTRCHHRTILIPDRMAAINVARSQGHILVVRELEACTIPPRTQRAMRALEPLARTYALYVLVLALSISLYYRFFVH
jgi:ankyrin repeat protein